MNIIEQWEADRPYEVRWTEWTYGKWTPLLTMFRTPEEREEYVKGLQGRRVELESIRYRDRQPGEPVYGSEYGR